jgi:hypothetical protein
MLLSQQKNFAEFDFVSLGATFGVVRRQSLKGQVEPVIRNFGL